MNENQFLIKDESSDRKYFTQIPNIIVDKYSAREAGVYLYIKRKAGERGEFFERTKVSAKNLGIHPQTFRKIREKFVKDGILEYLGERKEEIKHVGGSQQIKVFKIKDIN